MCAAGGKMAEGPLLVVDSMDIIWLCRLVCAAPLWWRLAACRLPSAIPPPPLVTPPPPPPPAAAAATCWFMRAALDHALASPVRGDEGREDVCFLVAGKLTLITKHHNYHVAAAKTENGRSRKHSPWAWWAAAAAAWAW